MTRPPDTDRFQPVMGPQRPETMAEKLLSLGAGLGGKPGYAAFRKLKRRYQRRNAPTFDRVVHDLRPGDLCIDLGANLGTFTARMAATGADVVALEPDPDTFAKLKAAIASHPNVTLHQKAAGAREEVLPLRRSARYAEDPDRFSEVSSIIRDDSRMDAANSVEVQVVDFTAFLRDLNRDVRLLKMDIEGAEWDLLDVLLKDPVLDRIDTIFVETHEWVDPPRCMAQSRAWQAWAEATPRPYLNLFWI